MNLKKPLSRRLLHFLSFAILLFSLAPYNTPFVFPLQAAPTTSWLDNVTVKSGSLTSDAVTLVAQMATTSSTPSAIQVQAKVSTDPNITTASGIGGWITNTAQYPSTSFDFTGLTPNTTYYGYVVAYQENGSEDKIWSNMVKTEFKTSKKDAYSVAGKVSGIPSVGNIPVKLVPTLPQLTSKSSITTATGDYTFIDVSPGTYTLSVDASNTYVAFSTEITVKSAPVVQDIVLTPVTPKVTVQVRDIDGKAVSGVYVYARAKRPFDDFKDGYTDATGTISFDLKTGEKYEICIYTSSWGTADYYIANGQSIDFTIPNFNIISGTIVKPDSTPVANAHIILTNDKTGVQYYSSSYEDGSYTLSYPYYSTEDSYTIKASYNPSGSASSAYSITASSTQQDMILYPSHILGQVIGSDGKPLFNARVDLYYGTIYSIRYTDTNGMFPITGLSEGSATVYVYASGYYEYKESFKIIEQNKALTSDKDLIIYPRPYNYNSTDYTVKLKATATAATVGDQITFRPTIMKNASAISGTQVTFKMTLPENVEMKDAGSLVHEGNNVYTYTTPISLLETPIQPFTVKIASADSDMLYFMAEVLYTQSGQLKNAKSDILPVSILYSTINGPATHKTGEGITIFGDASKDSNIVIKDRLTGFVYAYTESLGRIYTAKINLPKEGKYELVAEVSDSAIDTHKVVTSEPLFIEVGKDVISPEDIKVKNFSGGVYLSNEVYGIPTFSEYVNALLQGRTFKIEFDLFNSEGWTTEILFADKVYSTSVTGNHHIASISNWSGTGVKDVKIRLTKGDETKIYSAASVRIMIDPSGYIYDVDTKERIQNATATLEKLQSTGWVQWQDPEFKQLNPQLSDQDGRFEWYSEEGTYRVKVTKEGYTNIYGDSVAIANTAQGNFDITNPDGSSLTVLPVQLEVNIPMKRIGYTPPIIPPPTAEDDFPFIQNISSPKTTETLINEVIASINKLAKVTDSSSSTAKLTLEAGKQIPQSVLAALQAAYKTNKNIGLEVKLVDSQNRLVGYLTIKGDTITSAKDISTTFTTSKASNQMVNFNFAAPKRTPLGAKVTLSTNLNLTGLDITNLKLYYVNPLTKKLILTPMPVEANPNGDVRFSINHTGHYVIGN